MVLEQPGVPLAVGRVDESALGHALVLEHHPALPGPRNLLGPVDDDRPDPVEGPGDVQEVVRPLPLPELGALRPQAHGLAHHAVRLFDDDAIEAVGLDP